MVKKKEVKATKAPKAPKTPIVHGGKPVTMDLLRTEIASLTNQIRHHEAQIKNSTAVIQQAQGALMLAQNLLAQLMGVDLNQENNGPAKPGKPA